MRVTLHPLGILIAHLLPVLVLAVLYADALAVIHPLLHEQNLDAWRALGLWSGGAALASTVYAALLWWRRGAVHALYGALVFVVHVPLLWCIGENMSLLFPSDIPRWMMPAEPELYAFRLLSIPLAHALFVLVARSLPEGDRGKPLRDLLIAAGIPLAVYLFVQVVEPFRGSSDFEEHAWVVVMVCLTIGFLFLIFRSVTALVLRVGAGSVLAHIARVFVALVFPLLGLALNNGLFQGMGSEATGVFGDLSHPAFYLIAVINAAAVIWPSSASPTVRLIQFLLRAAGFTYVLYFFVLFVPLLPLSIVAIIAFGFGFLLLAPVLLFAVQAQLLWHDARFLAAHRSRRSIAVLFVLAMSMIPAALLIRYLSHRDTLHAALRYVFESDPNEPMKPLDADKLAHVLRQVDASKSRNRWRGDGELPGNTPFLTPLYNRIVLDHLTLSDEKSDLLHRVILDSVPRQEEGWRRAMPLSSETSLDSAWAQSGFDEAQQAWRSWVHLDVRNKGESQQEFVTDFVLPDGAWISDHYLVIEGDTARGILAEKKAALWVYNSIVSYRRDPSIVRYIGHNTVQLRVFPVEAGQARRTGIEILHREPVALRIGGQHVQLGDPSRTSPAEVVESGEYGVVFMPEALKRSLPLVKRPPHVHFIVDGTEGKRGMRAEVIARIERFVAEHAIDPARATLHITDAYGKSLPYGVNAFSAFAQHAGHGGFFTDRTVRKVIAAELMTPGKEAPLFVFVPSWPAHDERALGIRLDDLDELAACLPEGDGFLLLGDSGEATRHLFRDPQRLVNSEPIAVELPAVRAWPDAADPKGYVPDTPNGSVLVDYAHLGSHGPPRERWWPHALALEGRQRAHLMRSITTPATWHSLVRGSFAAQVLLPQTAWMCLEDEAQRNALLKKQEDALNSDPSLDAMDEELVTSMSEPGMLWLIVPILLFLLARRFCSWNALTRFVP